MESNVSPHEPEPDSFADYDPMLLLARFMADDICYKRQSEYSGMLTFNRLKLRRLIRDEMIRLVAKARAEIDPIRQSQHEQTKQPHDLP